MQTQTEEALAKIKQKRDQKEAKLKETIEDLSKENAELQSQIEKMKPADTLDEEVDKIKGDAEAVITKLKEKHDKKTEKLQTLLKELDEKNLELQSQVEASVENEASLKDQLNAARSRSADRIAEGSNL